MVGVLAESRNLKLSNTSHRLLQLSVRVVTTVMENGLGEGPYTLFLVIMDTCYAFFPPGVACAHMQFPLVAGDVFLQQKLQCLHFALLVRVGIFVC
jgi:hypothetical protein